MDYQSPTGPEGEAVSGRADRVGGQGMLGLTAHMPLVGGCALS